MHRELPDWFERLSVCGDIGSATGVLATALGDVSGGEAAGVFLLDADKSNLRLFASWSAARGGQSENFQPVSVGEKGDPLCFSLQQGSSYQADLNPTATMALIYPDPCNVFAHPLNSRINGLIGGIIVITRYGNPVQKIVPLQLLGMYASSLIGSIMLHRAETAIVDSLRNDLALLEKQKQQEQELSVTKIIGTSEAISRVRSLIIKVAPTSATVLVTGETGTGKELAAEAIHSLSPGKEAPFLKINCGALSPHLLESELFGHVKGAFTGADADNRGLLRAADGGSVLLDEIGDMPPELQVKLLRVLQDQKVRPVGDSKEYSVNIRIIAATNKNLQEAMARGFFRKDLYHRLAAFHIHIPPLRERRQDIPALTEYFFEKLCRKHGRTGRSLPPKAFLHFSSLPLDGNVRELANEIERGLLLSDSAAGDLSFSATHEDGNGQDGGRLDMRALFKEYEMDLIKRSQIRHSGNISRVAEDLGIPRTTLRRILEKGNS